MTLDDALRVPRRRRSSEERFWAKVDKTDSCWLWTAGLAHGYGQFRVGERSGSTPGVGRMTAFLTNLVIAYCLFTAVWLVLAVRNA